MRGSGSRRSTSLRRAVATTCRTMTINPNTTLAARTVYTATLTGGTTAIRDLAGNPLTTTRWSFTTGA